MISMVLIMITTWGHLSKVNEVGKIYLEQRKKNPIDKSIMKRIVPMGIILVKEGIRNTVIYEAKPGKEKEALADLTKRMLPYSEIEGFKCQIEVLMSGTEAFPLIGLQMPE